MNPDPTLTRATLWIVWLCILLFATLARVIDLEHVPAGFFRDEAEKGYNAFALARTGGVIEFRADAAGRTRPVLVSAPRVVNVAGSRTSTIYQRLTAPIVGRAGLSPGTTRLTAALTGAITVGALGALLLRFWSPLPAFAAMFWLAACPWHLVFSRWALQGIFTPLGMVAALGGAALVAGQRPVRGFLLLGAGLGFMFHAYAGAQPFALAWGAAIAVIHRRAIYDHPRSAIAGLALAGLLAAPRLWSVLFAGGGERLSAVAIWNAPDATAPGVAAAFISNYLAHFSPRFLFISGDELARACVPGLGQLGAADALLLPVGLAATFRRKMPLRWPLLMAFALGPVGAAVTREGIPHALRALPMMLPAVVWSGLGLVVAAEWINRRMTGRKDKGDAKRRKEKPQPGLSRRIRAGAAMTLLVGLALGSAVRSVNLYFVRMAADPAALSPVTGFGASHRKAFERAFADRTEAEQVWIDGWIPYAPYQAMFHGRLDPRRLADEGFEGMGIYVFDPRAFGSIRDRGLIRPGDRIVRLLPDGEADMERVP